MDFNHASYNGPFTMSAIKNYRPEIDGLRTVAVLPVLLFHAGAAGFGGGYVGVDVFFVISGYLITTILFREAETGTFSIKRFYERRARRILPALFLVMLASIPFALLWQTADQLISFGKSLLYVVLFVSNIFFWKEQNYFAPSAELSPMLHTWSLAIEEQFYLLFPIFVLLMRNRSLKMRIVLLATAAVASLLIADWGARNIPSANFFLLPSRAWELLAGSLCACVAPRCPPKQALSLLGLAFILSAVFIFDANTPFPSRYALLPVIGTCLIVLFGNDVGLTGKLLANRTMVSLGLISYSTYLWHQPLLAFMRIRFDIQQGTTAAVLTALSSIPVAFLTWKYVETPFRTTGTGKRTILSGTKVLALSAVGMLCFGLTGAYLVSQSGFPNRIAPSGITFASAMDPGMGKPNYGLSPKCEGKFTLDLACRTSPSPSIALWGDSYSMHLADALVSSPTNRPFVQFTKSQCAPILGLAVDGSETTSDQCIAFNDQVFDWIKNNQDVKFVILSSRLAIADYVPLDRSRSPASGTPEAATAAGLLNTANELRKAGKKVVIVAPPPSNDRDTAACVMNSRLYGRDAKSCDFSIDELSVPRMRSYELLRTIENKQPVLWLQALLCTNGVCHSTAENHAIYRDEGHISHTGSKWLGSTKDLMGRALSIAR